MSSKKADEKKEPGNNGADELSNLIEDLLNTLSTKFDGVSNEIFSKMDEMAKRIDNLESSLRAGDDPSNSSPSKS
ncbi:heat shock factor binding protein 1-domain-containing protein [Hypoxylon fragiforme]|uniref:heat shock factor binding protein 1-domain-containing protein n=1 Tax=Hypoxylon fragiforme TaxID=63214 RepID=UPI0020C5F44C|nr:heat shock factor binding protein 1-domain-containing protein [Hypoxylon fragiforme]KAI2608692.1 heat shock factor binding protein 1-domain-containing protein [Hypoxylon fragiforme]